MRKQKTIKIDNREITVYELKVKHIRELMDKAGTFEGHAGFRDLIAQAGEILPLATTLKAEDLEEMAPSEIQAVWDAFLEVNAVFFGLLKRAGIPEALEAGMREIMRQTLREPSVFLPLEGIPIPGNIPGVGS